MYKRLIVLLMVVGALGCVQSMAFGQTQPEQRIAQPIVLNGQQAQGVLVVLQNGTIQSYTCASPQPYTTPDGASSGWACFEATSGQWLLHALPPQPEAANPPSAAPVPAVPAPQATVVYGAPLPTYAPAVVPAYGYYPYSYYPAYYPYGYYPYSYSPYFVGPRYGVGFGFGYRGPVFAPRAVGGVSVVRAGGRVGGGRR